MTSREEDNAVTNQFFTESSGWDEADVLVHSYYDAKLTDNPKFPKAYRSKVVSVLTVDYGKGIVEATGDDNTVLFSLKWLPVIQ